MIKITNIRAIKIWWGYTWRSSVAMIPGMIIWTTFVFLSVIPKTNDPKMANPANDPGFMIMMFLMWIVVMAMILFTQCYAIKWLLKTKWSDFKLIAVAPDHNFEDNQSL